MKRGEEGTALTELNGRWTLTVIGNEAGWQQGARIIGSAARDGIYT